jgi:hypothetical protein
VPLALVTPESVTLAIAVVAVCAGVAQAALAGGSARKAGIIIASIVGVGAVLVYGVFAFVLAEDDGAKRDQFQARVVEICDDNRSLEATLNRQFAKLKRETIAGEDKTDFAAYMSGWIDLAARASYAWRQLIYKLEAIDAPSSWSALHQEAVLTWQRMVRLLDGALTAARLASTPEAAAAAVNDTAGGAQKDRLGTSRDAVLRELGGTECDPSLPVSVFAG